MNYNTNIDDLWKGNMSKAVKEQTAKLRTISVDDEARRIIEKPNGKSQTK